MKRPDKWRRHVAALVAVGTVVGVGCGGDDPPAPVAAPADTAGGTPGTTGTTGDAAAPAAAAMLVDPARGAELLDDGAVLIDVRTPEEFAEAHIDGALLVDVSDPDFDARLAELDPAVPYVVYCRTGNRSAAASARMAQVGFAEVYDMGGIQTWIADGFSVVAG